MIHMLSKFDLKSGCEIQQFKTDYSRFFEFIRALGLVEVTGEIGQRVKNTPMDTAGDSEPEYYAIMSFRDRDQLDAAYEYILEASAEQEDMKAHAAIHQSVTNSVFTCWQDMG